MGNHQTRKGEKKNNITTYSLVELDLHLHNSTKLLIEQAGLHYVCFSNTYGYLGKEVGKYRHIFTAHQQKLNVKQIYHKLHQVGIYLKIQVEPSCRKFIDDSPII